ncbi:unnamed protein product [Anisakis simplex]|uniref:WASH complex subunit CCDC53 homolog (inferred by orthology to a C. elegans protein) n=1 Tax=Anisakis simplex TaxID=6269 RepID=A0A0M3JZX0_ANISI|nr:unnamed protein product [Anisakis simplex]
MTEPDLSFISADINLEQVKALDTKRTIAFVNYFVMQLTHFLNSFATDVESRIIEMENRLERVRTCTLLLESKVDSVAGAGEVFVDQPMQSSPPKQTSSLESTNNVKSTLIKSDDSVQEIAMKPQETMEPAEENATELNATSQKTSTLHPVITIREDVRYEKYFKMLKMGVIEAAVKQKMVSEGVDPSFLDRPDAPSEGAAQPASIDASQRQHASTSIDDDDESDSVASFSDTE